MKRILLLALFLSPAAAAMDARQATAVFDRIRTTPAERALHCQELKLKDDSVKASMRRDSAELKRLREAIAQVQARLPGYAEALAFRKEKAQTEVDYFRAGEGLALDTAQRKLGQACEPPDDEPSS